MKNKIFIFTIVLTISVIIGATSYYLILDDKNKRIHESKWVEECIPADSHDYIPSILIENYTHTFDLRSCGWNLK